MIPNTNSGKTNGQIVLTKSTRLILLVISTQKATKKDKTTTKNKKQLSKEFVRRWLIENGFQGKKVTNSFMSDEYIETVSERYIELFENIIGEKFVKGYF